MMTFDTKPRNFRMMWNVMSRAEKMNTIKIIVLPYSLMKHNVFMWIINICFIGLVVFMNNLVDHRLFTHPSYDLVMLWMHFTSTVSAMYFVAHRLGSGLTSRKRDLHRQIMERTMASMEAYTQDALSEIKELSGRDHIDNNPIAIAAAHVDVMNKRGELDPLKRALQQLPPDRV